MVKWIKRGSPATNNKCSFTASRKTAINAVQDGILAGKGLTYDRAFSVNTLQFGTDLEKAVKAKIAKSVNFGNLEKAMLDAGTPPEIAKARVAAMIDSFNINSGINEAVRAFGVKTNGLKDDFWGADEVEAGEGEAAETVEVSC